MCLFDLELATVGSVISFPWELSLGHYFAFNVSKHFKLISFLNGQLMKKEMVKMMN